METTSWKQKKGQLVRSYVKFIENNLHELALPVGRGSIFYGSRRPKTKADWLVSGILPNILDMLREDVVENQVNLKWDDVTEAAQDAEFLLSLYKRKNLKIGHKTPVSNCEHFKVDADGFIIVYTDGACPGNGKPGAKAGIGVWFGKDHRL